MEENAVASWSGWSPTGEAAVSFFPKVLFSFVPAYLWFSSPPMSSVLFVVVLPPLHCPPPFQREGTTTLVQIADEKGESHQVVSYRPNNARLSVDDVCVASLSLFSLLSLSLSLPRRDLVFTIIILQIHGPPPSI